MVTRILSLLGIIASGWLVYNELQTGAFCPRIVKIPVCYPIAASFAFAFISTFLKQRNEIRPLLFMLATFVGIGVSGFLIIQDFRGIQQCLVLKGIPVCYVMLGAFFLLQVFNRLEYKYG